MASRTPTLRQRKDGRWVTKWGGRTHYFGRDKAEARKLFAENLTAWAAWKESRDKAAVTSTRGRPTVLDLAELYVGAKELEGGVDLGRYYRKHLKRFISMFGPVPADRIRPMHLHALKEDMLQETALHKRLAPKTVNHDLIAVKAMLTWAANLEHIPPVLLQGARTMPLGPPPDKSMPLKAIRVMIREAKDDRVKPWLRVNYLTLARPIEVVRLVHRQGEWVEPGIFRLDVGKTDVKSRQPRHLVCSEQALKALKRCEPVWSRLDSYSQAVRTACGPGGPHALRHSAATHLIQQGVDRASVDLLLGHMPSRVSLTYARIEWQPLRTKAALLRL